MIYGNRPSNGHNSRLPFWQPTIGFVIPVDDQETHPFDVFERPRHTGTGVENTWAKSRNTGKL